MSKWIEDISYISQFDIDKKFIRKTGLYYTEYKRFVKYPEQPHYTIYNIIIRPTVIGNDGYSDAQLLSSTAEYLTYSELLSKYPEFNILPDTHLIRRVVNNIKQILHDRRTTKEI